MISINDNAQSILDNLIEQNADYRLKNEFGISSFWYWYYQVKNNILALQSYNTPIGDNLIFKMDYWGDIIYSRIIHQKQVYIIVTGFKFNGINFKKWLKHQPLNSKNYSIVGDAGYRYKIIQSTSNNKYAILTPQRKYLTKFVFDEIIGFHHSSNDFNTIYAIGFQENRVFAIYQDGKIEVLPYSKEEYLNKKHKYYESLKPRKMMINESHIRQIIRETLRRYLQL